MQILIAGFVFAVASAARAADVTCSADSLAGPAAVIEACKLIIDSEVTERPARLAALLVRARLNAATDKADLAIADFSAALTINPAMADALNARGELRRAKGDRPRALMDFTAALKIDPDHTAARDNRKSLSQEIERIGAEMVVGKKGVLPLK